MFNCSAVRFFFFFFPQRDLKKIFLPIIICSLHQLAKNDLLGIYYVQISVKVKVTQLCLTLCNPMDYTVHGILQARILEWVT